MRAACSTTRKSTCLAAQSVSSLFRHEPPLPFQYNLSAFPCFGTLLQCPGLSCVPALACFGLLNFAGCSPTATLAGQGTGPPRSGSRGSDVPVPSLRAARHQVSADGEGDDCADARDEDGMGPGGAGKEEGKKTHPSACNFMLAQEDHFSFATSWRIRG